MMESHQQSGQLPPPTNEPPRQPAGVGFATMALGYLLLGLALAWGIQQYHQEGVAVNNARVARTAADELAGRQFDLGRFLAEPFTGVARMREAPGSGMNGTVAWNPNRQDGIFCSDQLKTLPPGQVYQLWFGTEAVATVSPVPGQSVYWFHPEHPQPIFREVTLTAGMPASDLSKAGRVMERGTATTAATRAGD